MLRKYPRTRHIAGSRLQPGDHDLAAVPFEAIAGRFLVVEEKLDGANAGISSGRGSATAARRRGVPVVSLDRLRAETGVDPAGDQRAVAAAAYELARDHLRAGRSFVWNATNVSRQHRELCTGLVAGYRGRVEVVALEAPPRVLRDRNRARSSPVPDAVIDRLVRRWETPDPTEAHRVDWLSTG